MDASKNSPRLIYAANRQLGLNGLELLIERNWKPIGLLLPKGKVSKCADEMQQLLPNVPVLWGKEFKSIEGIQKLSELEPDYILSIHFPYMFPAEILKIPKIGVLNLHPAFLPFNRGWHSASWTILEDTPFGVTLHWVDEELDSGDIFLQKQIEVHPDDTANTLYRRALTLEKCLLGDAIRLLLKGELSHVPQSGNSTFHKKGDLISRQELCLEEKMKVKEVLKQLRALTTDRLQEAAYYEVNGVRYRVKIEIVKE